MAHSVSMSFPKTAISTPDVEFAIKKNGVLLGKLHISKGNIQWWPSGASRNGYKFSWTTLAEVFLEHGTPVKR